MIIDKTENLEKYDLSFLKPVLGFLHDTDMSLLERGKTLIDGDCVFVNIVDRVLTAEPTTWEVHKKYIDVHVMLSGKEKVYYSDGSGLSLSCGYSDSNDSALYEGTPSCPVSTVLSKGDAAIFFPGEIHLTNGPCGSEAARKAIFKVLLEH